MFRGGTGTGTGMGTEGEVDRGVGIAEDKASSLLELKLFDCSQETDLPLSTGAALQLFCASNA